MYVVDRGNCCVQILNSDLSYVGTFGNTSDDQSLIFPAHYLAFDRAGNVYVSNSSNITVFTAEGEFLRKFGKHGVGAGDLAEPMGVAIDSNETVYVSDRLNHRVSLFTLEGQFKTSFGSEGDEAGQFSKPSGLAVDGCGIVYVCSSYNRVQLF